MLKVLHKPSIPTTISFFFLSVGHLKDVLEYGVHIMYAQPTNLQKLYDDLISGVNMDQSL